MLLLAVIRMCFLETLSSHIASLAMAAVANNSARAHIISHSLGGPTVLSFLQAQGNAWCSKYIASFIPVSAPWAGDAQMAKAEVGGDNLGEPIPHDYLRSVQQQAESGVFLLPYGTGTVLDNLRFLPYIALDCAR